MQVSALVPVVLGLAASACSSAPPRSIPPPPGPVPDVHLSLEVRGYSIGLVGAQGGPMCDGEITGIVDIATPNGTTERLSVGTKTVSDVACVGCDPVPGDVHSCDNACRKTFHAFIELARFTFPWPGRYEVTGADLVLSCAPGQFHVTPTTVTTAAVPTPPSSPPEAEDRPLSPSP